MSSESGGRYILIIVIIMCYWNVALPAESGHRAIGNSHFHDLSFDGGTVLAAAPGALYNDSL